MLNSRYTLSARLLAEFLGSALLLCIVIGSGIMAERLSAGNMAVALLGNTFATVFGLVLLIELFGPISGAHFNPVVTVLLAVRKTLQISQAFTYILAQCAGAIIGVWLAHLMFDLNVLQFSTKTRTGGGQWLGEIIATFGLLLLVLRAPTHRASMLIAAWIGAAYWFTSSTSFANPVAVLGRSLSNTFAGIAPTDALAFVVAQFVGGFLALWVHNWFERKNINS
jgi:glycerol uptake facilitator-like aquaporin